MLLGNVNRHYHSYASATTMAQMTRTEFKPKAIVALRKMNKLAAGGGIQPVATVQTRASEQLLRSTFRVIGLCITSFKRLDLYPVKYFIKLNVTLHYRLHIDDIGAIPMTTPIIPRSLNLLDT